MWKLRIKYYPQIIGLFTALFFLWSTVLTPEVFWNGRLYALDPMAARWYGAVFLIWTVVNNLILYKRTAYIQRTFPLLLHMMIVILNGASQILGGNFTSLSIGFVYAAFITAIYRLEVVDGNYRE